MRDTWIPMATGHLTIVVEEIEVLEENRGLRNNRIGLDRLKALADAALAG
jgi:hypothetical protein